MPRVDEAVAPYGVAGRFALTSFTVAYRGVAVLRRNEAERPKWLPAVALTAAMVLVPPAFLSAVRDAAPAEIRLQSMSSQTRPAPSTEPAADAEAAADRLDRYAAAGAAAGAGRSSRSDAQLRIFTRANQDATTTTTEAPTTTAAEPETTTTTAKPKPTTTTARPKAAAATTTTSKPTTTTARPATTTTTAGSTTSTMGSPPPCCRQEGGASYHDYSDPRTCAHRSLAKGTALRVTNLENGKKTTCVVNDRGPYVEGRIIDLSRSAFGEIASVSDGVIRVAIEW